MGGAEGKTWALTSDKWSLIIAFFFFLVALRSCANYLMSLIPCFSLPAIIYSITLALNEGDHFH